MAMPAASRIRARGGQFGGDLESQLQMHLNRSRRPRNRVSAEGRGIIDVALQPEPLVPIEYVEELGSELEPGPFDDTERSVDGQILVQYAAIAHIRLAIRVPEGPRRGCAESG